MNRRLALLVLLAATLACTAIRVDLSELLSSNTLALFNNTKYVFFSELHGRTLREAGALWGYDPTFAAGYLSGGFAWGTTDYLPSLLVSTGAVSGSAVIKGLFLALFLCSPLLGFASARLFGLGVAEATVAGLLTLLLDQFSLNLNFTMRGMISSTLGLTLVLPIAAVFHHLNRKAPRIQASTVFLVVAGAVVAGLNPQSLAVLAVAVGGVGIWHRRPLWAPAGAAGAVVVVGAVTAFLLPWVVPGLHYLDEIPSGFPLISILRCEWLFWTSWGIFVVLLQPLALLICGTGVYEIVRRVRARDPVGLYLLFVAGVALVVVVTILATGRGFTFPVRYLQWILTVCTLPSAAFLVRHLGSREAWKRVPGRIAGLGVLLVIVAQVALSLQTGSYRSYGAEESEPFMELVDWARNRTDASGRILIETSPNSEVRSLGFDYVGLLALFVPEREYLSLPEAESPGVYYSAFLQEGALSWLPIGSYSDDDLAEYLKAYNIRWVVAFDPRTIERFRRSPSIARPKGQVGAFAVFEATRIPSFFLRGSGSVEAGLNRIRLSDLVPDPSGEVVLSYHRFGSLRTLEGVPLDVEERPFDPFGFIKIRNPPGTLTIVNDTSAGFPRMDGSIARFIDRTLARLRQLGIRTDLPPCTGYRYCDDAGDGRFRTPCTGADGR